MVCASVLIGLCIIHVHAATNFLAIPAAQSGSNSHLSPLVHHYSSCSSLEFRVLPFSLRPTLWRKSAARAHVVRRLTARACVCVRASWHRAVTGGMLCAALGKVRKCWDWIEIFPCLLRRTRYSPLSVSFAWISLLLPGTRLLCCF